MRLQHNDANFGIGTLAVMSVIRRPLAALIVAALLLPAVRAAQAQDYPNRPIRPGH